MNGTVAQSDGENKKAKRGRKNNQNVFTKKNCDKEKK